MIQNKCIYSETYVHVLSIKVPGIFECSIHNITIHQDENSHKCANSSSFTLYLGSVLTVLH